VVKSYLRSRMTDDYLNRLRISLLNLPTLIHTFEKQNSLRKLCFFFFKFYLINLPQYICLYWNIFVFLITTSPPHIIDKVIHESGSLSNSDLRCRKAITSLLPCDKTLAKTDKLLQWINKKKNSHLIVNTLLIMFK
jgi:hypothetical protein